MVVAQRREGGGQAELAATAPTPSAIKTLPRCVALSIPIGATPRVGGGQAAAGGSRSASLLPVALKAWFELGGDVNATDEHGRSLLHYASVAANAEVVTELIERGAAVDARNNAQTTALCMVAHAGHDAIAALLLAAGAIRTPSIGAT